MSDIGLQLFPFQDQHEMKFKKNVNHRQSKSMHTHDPNTHVLVSYSCHNKLLQILWLKTADIYSFRVLGNISLKSRCLQGCTLSRGTRKECVPLPAFGGCQLPWLMAASHQSLPLPSLLCVSVFSSSVCLIRTLVIGFRADLDNPGRSQNPQLNHICKKPFLQIR